MGIMGLMNSKGALGRHQHNSWMPPRVAKKDTHRKAGSRKCFQILWRDFPQCWKKDCSIKRAMHKLPNVLTWQDGIDLALSCFLQQQTNTKHKHCAWCLFGCFYSWVWFSSHISMKKCCLPICCSIMLNKMEQINPPLSRMEKKRSHFSAISSSFYNWTNWALLEVKHTPDSF